MSDKTDGQSKPANGEQDSGLNKAPPGDGESAVTRRGFFKASLAGAAGVKGAIGGAAGLGVIGVGAYAVAKTKGTEHQEFPVPIRDDYRPMDQRNTVLTFAASKKLNDEHRARIEKFGGFEFHEQLQGFKNPPPRDTPGYTQLDRALANASWKTSHAAAPAHEFCQPDSGVYSWDQSGVAETQYKFATERDAAQAIKTAARLFGAVRCGITKRDRRWDYDPLYDIHRDRTLSWEKDFPFGPKTVIVCLHEMDYEAVRTAPAWPEAAAAGDAYSEMVKVAGQLADFIRRLGYRAVGAGNDLGLSVPYAVAAGLGEGARNGALIAPKLGPRVRISKVYTDLDFVDYDLPRSFGVTSFCANCKRCADACPSEAISFDDKPSFEPTYEKREDPEYSWSNNAGALKWHNDSKKCFKFWIENGSDCGSCICACPYNKPDFWHHGFIDAMNVIAPGPAHALMREMDIWFGYGTTFDEEQAKSFWKSGKDMRGG